MEFLSERVSVDRNSERTSVVISARYPRGKEAVLVAWTVAWALCGIYIMYGRTELPDGDPVRQYLLVFLAFWAYFMLKVGRATLWRLKGFELWRIKDGTVTIKDSLFGYGKANTYFVDNIQKMAVLESDPSSWKHQWNNSIWIIGGERLVFEHLGKKAVFGKGLNDAEAKQLLGLLKQVLKEERKKVVSA